MAESSFFFTSSGGDRKYTSGNFATFFYELTQRGEGVIKSIDNELQVTNPGTLSVNINTGTSVKRGYLYNNSTSLNKALDAVTSGSQRIDRIVTRVDLTARTMSVVIIKGTESASPSAPSIDGTTDVLLAKILVNNTSGTPVYTVTDERVYRTAIASIGGMTAADALSGVTPSTVGKSMLSAADQAAQQTLITAGAVGIAALNATSLSTVTGFKAADTANVAGTTPGARGLTALSQATTLDADSVGGLSASVLAPIGSISLFGGPTSPPTGWLSCDGSSLSRSTYSSLFSVLVKSIGTFTVTLATPGVFTLTAHGLTSGDGVYFTTTGSLPTGLSSNTIYFVTVVTVDTFKVSTTYANYVAGTFVNTSVSQSGTHTSFRSPWGVPAGGTTNFYLPDLRLTAQGIPNATAAVGGWNTYTPSIVDSSGTSVLSASPMVNVGYWRRVGSNMEVRFAYYHQTTVGTLGAAGNYRIKIPSGYTIDSSFTSGSGNSAVAVGVASGDLGGGTLTNFTLGLEPSFNGVRAGNLATGNQFASGGNFQMNTAYLSINGSFTVPIAQWTTNNNLVTYVIKY